MKINFLFIRALTALVWLLLAGLAFRLHQSNRELQRWIDWARYMARQEPKPPLRETSDETLRLNWREHDQLQDALAIASHVVRRNQKRMSPADREYFKIDAQADAIQQIWEKLSQTERGQERARLADEASK